MQTFLILVGFAAFFELLYLMGTPERRREAERKRLKKEVAEKDKTISNFQGLLGGIVALDQMKQLEAEFAAKDRQLVEAQRRAAEAEATVARLLDTRQLKT